MLKGLLSNAATGSQSNLKQLGKCHSRPALSAWPRTSQTFFPDTTARERGDAAFYEPMPFMQQEGIDEYDDESDEMTATSTKKKRALKRPILQ